MSTPVILNPGEVPAGGFVYRDPQTEFVIKHNNLESLFNMAMRHREANHLAFSAEEFTSVVCASTKGIGCSTGETPSRLSQAKNLARDMGNWAKSGFSMARADVLESRRAICENCEHWGGVKGGPLIKGRCRLCGCRGVKLALATSVCPAGRW